MSSRRIQAMAALIDAIYLKAKEIPCDGDYPCRCEIRMMIDAYRNQFQAPKARSARSSSSGSTTVTPEIPSQEAGERGESK